MWHNMKHIISLVILVIYVGLAAGSISEEDLNKARQKNNSTSSRSNTKVNTISLNVVMPKEESAFITAVSSFYNEYRAANNELKKSSVRVARKKLLQSSYSNRKATKWVGKLDSMHTNSEGKAYISIGLPNTNIKIKTWNNALSDIGDGTLITNGSALYNSLANLSKGDIVEFSGNFNSSNDDYLKEGSLTESGSMLDPEFIFNFKTVVKYKEQ